MDESAERRPRLRIGIGAGVVVLVVALASGVLFSAVAPKGETTAVSEPEVVPIAPDSTAPATAAPALIFVHILGQVNSPGLYEFPVGARGVDAVAAAGGFAKNADQSGLNLARVLSDGEQIIVPKKGEAPPSTGIGTTPAPGALVNLNTADQTALETLPGIGPALARRIVAWRGTNGRFASVDDLGSVTGIGDKTLDSLRALVTV